VSRKLVKVLMANLLIFIMAGLLTGCKYSDQTGFFYPWSNVEKGKIKIAYSTFTLSSPYFTEVVKGIKDKAAEYGWECQINDPKGEVTNQLSALENFIAHKVDAILVSPLEENACSVVIKKAKEAGIVVIDLNAPVEEADVFITPDEYEIGYAIGIAAGEWASRNLKKKAKVATYHVKEHPSTMIREKGMRDGIRKMAGDAEFIASLSALTPEEGIKNMEVLIQIDRDINIIVGCNDSGVMGSYEVARTARLDLNSMFFGGIDAVRQALALIQKEKKAGKGAYRATVDIIPYKTGTIAVDTTKRLLEKQSVPSYIKIPAKLVNWDNIDDYFKN